MRLIKKLPDESQVLFFAGYMFRIALIHIKNADSVKIFFIDKHLIEG